MESEATVSTACGGSRWINGMAEERDPRWRAWLRVEVQGEAKVEVAWDLSCWDWGSVLQILKQIEARCRKDKEWKIKYKNTTNGCQESKTDPDELGYQSNEGIKQTVRRLDEQRHKNKALNPKT